ncbi:hypothetical protein GCM10022237_12510 [Nocardioides ginsengisoli]|uniref:Uncharacterized protein n=1 Tax=Nocardioides ginsengisoli TaxID=363868 RepID=A0ABW3W3V4_9ACTN
MSERKPKAAVRITTIEGPRSVTKGTSSIAEYGKKRRSFVSSTTKIGKSKYA